MSDRDRQRGRSIMDNTTKAALAGGAAGALVTAAVAWYLQRAGTAASAKNDADEQSTTSSSQSVGVYETSKAVSEYLMFHFGAPSDILPYDEGPHSALNFASRTADICVDWVNKLGLPLEAALDVGCAVGRTSFDLSKSFNKVTGLDFSHAFIDAANRLKTDRQAQYTMTVEGDITQTLTAVVPEGVRPERIRFTQGDACNLPSASALGGPFTVIHGANLLCRLPEPRHFLDRLPSLLVPGGVVVFVSPYSWLKQYTPKDKWLGGRVDAASGQALASKDGLNNHMRKLGFTLVHTGDCPFLIREHARKFQWGCSHITVWQLKTVA